MIALGWLIFVPIEREPHAEESVEQRWMERSLSAAMLDVIGAGGVALALMSVFDLTADGRTLLLLVVAGGMGDTMLRYVVVSRREAWSATPDDG